MTIITIIKSKYDKFSKSEKKVADFVIEHPKKIETNTITKVALETQTSTSAVLRFCKTLGFAGYKEFRYEMVQYVRSGSNINKGDEESDATSQIGASYVNAVSELVTNPPQAIKDLVKKILVGHRIFLVGIYQSSLPASYLQKGLQDLGLTSRLAGDINNASHMANVINKDDLLIYFSISGNLSNFHKSLGELEDSMPDNAFLITLNPKAELSQLFKTTILLPGHSILKKTVIDSQSLSMIFVEMLFEQVHEGLMEAGKL